MTSEEPELVIRVIEAIDGETGKATKKLCLIRLFKDATDEPRPVIELDRDGQRFYTYEVVRTFSSIKEAHDYAEEHDIFDVEY